jgi:hypothetical protein
VSSANYSRTNPVVPFVEQDGEQDDRDQVNRRKTLGSVLRYAHQNVIGGVGLVELVDALGLEAELDDLAGVSAERHRRLTIARERLELETPSSDGS